MIEKEKNRTNIGQMQVFHKQETQQFKQLIKTISNNLFD